MPTSNAMAQGIPTPKPTPVAMLDFGFESCELSDGEDDEEGVDVSVSNDMVEEDGVVVAVFVCVDANEVVKSSEIKAVVYTTASCPLNAKPSISQHVILLLPLSLYSVTFPFAQHQLPLLGHWNTMCVGVPGESIFSHCLGQTGSL